LIALSFSEKKFINAKIFEINMKTKLILVLLLLSVLFSQAIAMGPGSSDLLGNEKNSFRTDTPVYLTHIGTLICGNDVIWKQNVTAYIVPDSSNWTYGTNLSGIAVVAVNISVGIDSKIPKTMIWEKPQVGSWDIILDLNKNGAYDGTCPDLIDDEKPVGFTVTPTSAAPVNNTANQNVTANVTKNATVPQTNKTTVTNVTTTTPTAKTNETTQPMIVYNGTDYTPITILTIAIVIAVVIVVWTIRTIH
jgi:hypothetical protein